MIHRFYFIILFFMIILFKSVYNLINSFLTLILYLNYHIYIFYINSLIISVFLIINSLINTEKLNKIFLIIVNFKVVS